MGNGEKNAINYINLIFIVSVLHVYSDKKKNIAYFLFI